ncbi:hypothetical protein J9874_02822 [Duffyella gerundensis]|nr:hypothetical protein J9874_02822 [Duffyella gerundensis]
MPDHIPLSTLIRTSQRRMNQCIALDARTGSPLRRHSHFLQVTSIYIAGYGSMLFPAFLLPALPDCRPGDEETLTIPDASKFESQCPWYSILTAEVNRLGLPDVTREIRQLSPLQREEYALVIFSRLAVRSSLHEPSDLTQWRHNHQTLSRLTEEHLFFTFYNQWPESPNRL